MSRIRIISPRVPPPKNTVLQWFHRDGATIIGIHNPDPDDTVAWCLPAQLDGTASGPVHSLEAQELPEPGKRVLIRAQVRSVATWFVGFHTGGNWRAVTPPYDGDAHITPDAWRPLPDDEPGDAGCPVGIIDAKEAADRRYVKSLERRCDELSDKLKGDAELLEAAREMIRCDALSRAQFSEAFAELRELVQRRSSK